MPTDRSRPDACPGALQLHQAADGALARVRLPGGAIGGDQIAALAEAARDLGSGMIELTSRGNLQVRGLRDGCSDELAERLSAAGLLPSRTHERARNIMASPLSGLDGLGAADVRSLVPALDEGLCARPVLAGLSGRFLFALDDGRGDVVPRFRADLGARAVSGDRYEVLVAGRGRVTGVGGGEVVAALLAGAGAFLALRERGGSEAWRIAELDGAVPAVVAAVRGVLGGDEDRGRPDVAASPKSVEEGSGGVRAGVAGRRTSGGRELVAVAADASLGRMSAGQALVLARFARIVVTPWRGIVVPDVPGGEAAALLAELAAAGFAVDPESVLAGVTACTGRPGCAKALGDVQRDAPALVVTGGGAVHLSGCERRCGKPSGRFVDVVAAMGGGYRVGGGAVLSRREEIGAAVAAAREGL
ncbi:precorrin-3B synthase [Actinocorallia longicatena]|uniref:Precorrin-3B synthase n=1 Tax=Actinocorallia longicatena TaxID=111803 RepID=A0ABP6QBP3_9ACTN